MASITKKPLYSVMEGVIYPTMFSPKCFSESLHYKPRSDDVFIITYPKCGTTWIQNLILYLFRKGEALTNHRDFLKCCPFIDMLGQQSIDCMPRPGALKTHLPYHRMPYSPQAKYIFVTRNPMDCCVSLYHHTKMLIGFGFWDATFDEFFELFMDGQVEYNDYFDHLLSWFPHRRDQNVFYTTYEDMKKNTEQTVMRVANFLGKEYGELVERDNTMLKNILHLSSFGYMKENISPLMDTWTWKDDILNDPDGFEGLKHIVRFIESLKLPESRPKFEFVREGNVGGWKNCLSSEQCERLQHKFDDKFKGTDIPSLWSSNILH